MFAPTLGIPPPVADAYQGITLRAAPADRHAAEAIVRREELILVVPDYTSQPPRDDALLIAAPPVGLARATLPVAVHNGPSRNKTTCRKLLGGNWVYKTGPIPAAATGSCGRAKGIRLIHKGRTPRRYRSRTCNR